jgi:hypothetical protein
VRSRLNYLGFGAAIAGVVAGSAADNAGLEPGGRIRRIDNTDVHASIRISFPNDIIFFEDEEARYACS